MSQKQIDEVSHIDKEINVVEDTIRDFEIEIRGIITKIKRLEEDIADKKKKKYSACEKYGHYWEMQRDNYMYGDKWQECSICGMCK